MLRSVCAKPTTCTVIRCEIAERFEISTGGIFDSTAVCTVAPRIRFGCRVVNLDKVQVFEEKVRLFRD
jgi:hypothetical protein